MTREEAFYIIGNIPIPTGNEDYDICQYQEAKAIAIDSIEKLPEQVVLNSELKGSNLLDEYLRYLLKTSKLNAQMQSEIQNAESASIGSQSGASSVCDSARNEFIKGIWSRN